MSATLEERVRDLESVVFQSNQRQETISTALADLADKASNHGRALSSTMQDLSLTRQDLAKVMETQAAHTEALQRIEATLTKLAGGA